MEEEYQIEGYVPDGKLSFSRIKTVQTCAHKYYLQYVEKAKGMSRIPMLLGRNWHSAQEYGIKKMIEKSMPKKSEVVEVGVESLKIDLKKTKAIEFTEFDSSKDLAKSDLKNMIHFGFEKIAESFIPKASEHEFKFNLPDEEKTEVQGRIDVMEKDEEGDGITEMKTTARKPHPLVAFDWQTSIYQYGKESVKWLKKFFVIRHKNIARDLEIQIYRKKADSPETLKSIIDSVMQIKQAIKTFTIYGFPKTQDLQTCKWCAFRFGCRPEIFQYENNLKEFVSIEAVEYVGSGIDKQKRKVDINAIYRGQISEGRDGQGNRKGSAFDRSKSKKLPDNF